MLFRHKARLESLVGPTPSWHGSGGLQENLDLGALAFLSGILVLIFAQRMKRHMRIRGAMYPKLLGFNGSCSETFEQCFQRFLTEWQQSLMILRGSLSLCF